MVSQAPTVERTELSVAARRMGHELIALALGGSRTFHDGSREHPYDAFISYSRSQDAPLAITLQRGLHSYAKPWYRLRALRVFRDDGSLGANASLSSSIENALDSARFLLLLACERSARSDWVRKEVQYWCQRKSTSNILIVLTDPQEENGVIRPRRLTWDQETGDFDWNNTTAVGTYLAGLFQDEPRFVDLGWVRSRDDFSLRDPLFVEAIADLAAPIRGIPKDQLVGEDVRQHGRARIWVRWTIMVLIVLTTLATGAAVVAVQQRNTALARTAVAEAGQYAAQARSQADPFAALGLAVAAEHRTPTPLGEARAAYTTASSRLSSWTTRLVTDLNGDWKLGVGSVLTWSPDGREVNAARGDGSVLRWRFADDAALPEVGGLASSALTVRWSDDRRTQLLASGSDVLVRDTRVEDPTLASYTVGHVTDASLSPDGQVLLAAGSGGLMRRWRISDGAAIGDNLVSGPTSFPHVDWSPDGARFAVVDIGDGALSGLQIFDAGSAAVVAHPLKAGAWSLSWAPDNTRVAAGEDTGPIHVLDVRQNSSLTLNGHTGRVRALKWSPDSSMLVSAGDDGTVRLWDGSTGLQIGPSLIVGVGSGALDVAWSPDNRYIAALFYRRNSLARYSSNESQSVRVWELGNRASAAVTFPGLDNEVSSLAWSPNGDYLAGSDSAGKICVWDAARRTEVASIRPPEDDRIAVANLTWSPDGSTLASTSDDGVRLWRWETFSGAYPEPLWNSGGALALAWSSDGARLASGNDRGAIQIWHIGTPRATTIRVSTESNEFGAASAQLRILAWTAVDKYLLGVTNDGRIHKWDVASSRSVDAPVPVASAAMSSISWPRNTDRVASGDQTEVIRILGLDGRQAAPSIVTGDGPATAMIWSPDGTMLASSGSGGSIRIWDVATGAMLGQTEATQNSNWLSLAWRPDGSQLVSGDSRGRVHLWQSLTERRACELVAAKLTVTPLTRALAPVGLESCSNIELLRDFPTIPVLASVGG